MQFGDPTPLGWMTTLGYALAAVTSCMATWRVGVAPLHRTSQLWVGVTFLMLLMGLNKQLDWQTGFYEAAETIVTHVGWYEFRHVLKVAFIALLAAGTGIALALGGWFLRREIKRVWIGAIGVVLIGLFAVGRAMPPEIIGRVVSIESAALAWSSLEWAGIACVLFGGAIEWRSRPHAS